MFNFPQFIGVKPKDIIGIDEFGPSSCFLRISCSFLSEARSGKFHADRSHQRCAIVRIAVDDRLYTPLDRYRLWFRREMTTIGGEFRLGGDHRNHT